MEEAILQQPTQPIDELEDINKLQHILVQEKRNKISLPTSKATKKSSPAVPHEFQPNMEPTSNPRPSPAPMSKTTNIPNYISDNDKENLENTVPNPTTSVWRSSEQIRRMKDRTQSIKKIMEIPPLKIKTAPQYTRGLAQANQYLQLQEWARGGAF